MSNQRMRWDFGQNTNSNRLAFAVQQLLNHPQGHQNHIGVLLLCSTCDKGSQFTDKNRRSTAPSDTFDFQIEHRPKRIETKTQTGLTAFDLLVGKEVIQQLNVGRGIEIRYEARVEENDSIVLNAHSMPSKSLRLDRAE